MCLTDVYFWIMSILPFYWVFPSVTILYTFSHYTGGSGPAWPLLCTLYTCTQLYSVQSVWYKLVAITTTFLDIKPSQFPIAGVKQKHFLVSLGSQEDEFASLKECFSWRQWERKTHKWMNKDRKSLATKWYPWQASQQGGFDYKCSAHYISLS